MSLWLRKYTWWLVPPLIVGLITWGPYWLWNILSGSPWPAWRVPLIGDVVFDTYAYLEWTGVVMSGLPYGGHLRWFSWIIRVVSSILPSSISVSELWLFTRWLTTTATLWIGAWGFRQWAGLPLWKARCLSVSFWLSLVLVLGMRPGVYSWYFPFCLFATVGAFRVFQEVERSRIGRAMLWSVVAVIASSIYTWFFIFVCVWLMAIWTRLLVRRWPRLVGIGLIMGIVVGIFMAMGLADLLLRPEYIAHLDIQERHGLAYTRLPFIGNSLLVAFGWMVVWIAALLSKHFEPQEEERILATLTAWSVAVLGWCSSLFTGLYIHNDHFRSPILLLSWLSLGLMWQLAVSAQTTDLPLTNRLRRWVVAYLPYAVLGGAVLFILHILIQPYAFNHDDLNVLHLSHWFALAVGVSLWVFRERLIGRSRPILAVIVIGSSLIGGVALISVLEREFARLPGLVSYAPVVTWIREHVPTTEAICTDPKTSNLLTPHLARRVYPSFHSVVLPETHAELLQKVRILAGAYAVKEAGVEGDYDFYSEAYRGTICVQYPLAQRLLRRFHVSEDRINELIGCPAEATRHARESTQQAFGQLPDPADFSRLCPWVLIPQNQQRYWSLPQTYRPLSLEHGFSMWKSFEPE